MKLVDLTENTNDGNLEQNIDIVIENCKPFLNDIMPFDSSLTEPLVFRGMRGEEGSFIRKKSRNDRQPLSTSKIIHEFINDWFKNNFGYEYRSKGVFGTGSVPIAQNYGRPYAIFPVGNYEYIWSPNISDLYTIVMSAAVDGFDKLDTPAVERNKIIKYAKSIEDIPKEVRIEILKKLRKGNYKHNEGIKEAIDKKREIMFKCDSYYGIKIDDYDDSQKIINALKKKS